MLRELEGLGHQVRLERLAATLAERPVPVAHSRHARIADRLTLWLDDGSVLALRLYRPCRVVVAAVVALRWDDRAGWLVTLRLADGTHRVVVAWRATVSPPTGPGLSRRWG